MIDEDAIPVNAVGPGHVAGLGTGPFPDSQPGVPKKRRLRVILNNARMLTRKKPNAGSK